LAEGKELGKKRGERTGVNGVSNKGETIKFKQRYKGKRLSEHVGRKHLNFANGASQL